MVEIGAISSHNHAKRLGSGGHRRQSLARPTVRNPTRAARAAATDRRAHSLSSELQFQFSAQIWMESICLPGPSTGLGNRTVAALGTVLISMIVGLTRARRRKAGDAAPGTGAPIVGDFLRKNPRRKFHVEKVGEGAQIRFVHFAKLYELGCGGLIVSKLDASLDEGGSQPLKFAGWQAVGVFPLRTQIEELGQIDNGVSAYGESEASLPRRHVFDTR